MADIHGTYDERFAQVRDVLAANLDAGLDLGASVAVFLRGEPVVDIWGGYVDEAKTRPWEQDTIINVWSTTKTMAALCSLILADRGELDLHAPVARYWPEFAAASKERVEVRHLLAHTAGLSGWAEPVSIEDLYDWEKATSLLAVQEPWWSPGTASGYHAVTQGYLVGEVVRRVTGQTLGTFFANEVAGPLGADFHIGTPSECDDRVAPVVPPPSLADQLGAIDPDSVAARTFSNPVLDASVSFEIPWRRAEIPAANGHGNARSVGVIQSVLACGGEVGGVRLLSEKGCEAVFEEQANGTDLVLGVPLRFGVGYGLSGELLPIGPRACFWGGWGGSLIIADYDLNLVVTYVMNKMESGLVGDVRGAGVALAAFAAATS
ncbi:MAG: serine hydrolase domain-containing protein [Acidimicrobiales bacterium]|jgi:CubicO group peptidase (beta-lactamase class C family)